MHCPCDIIFFVKSFLNLIKILFFFIVCLFSVSSKANNFETLDSNINFEDQGAVYYLSSRCASLYISVAGLLKERSAEVSKNYQETSEMLMVIVYMLDMKLQNTSQEEAIERSNELITEMVELYRDDMASNYVKTGNYFEDTYIADDLLSCKSFIETILK